MIEAGEEAPRQERKRVTSADVAKASGVSRATVSYVLNNAPGRAISEQTRELVMRTARELGHLPFAPARTLRLGRSDVVLALVRDFSLGYVSNEILHHLDVALAERGYLVLVHRLDESLRSIAELWGAISPAMVVVMGGMSPPDESMIEGSNTKLLKVHGGVHHARAGELQMEYLLSRGHRRVGYAYPTTESVQLVAVERFSGADRVARDRGVDPLAVESVDMADVSTVTSAVDRWLSGPEPVTAICAHNDEIALAVMAALAERGVVIGEDVAVIGIDDIPAARVSLTTVKVDHVAWGAAVVRAVVAMLDGEDAPPLAGEYLTLIPRTSA